MAAENIRDLRWTLDSTIDRIGVTGEEVIVVGRDGHTELVAIVSMTDYRRLRERSDE